MTKLDGRTIANMKVALEKACRVFPDGGDHESRKYIAQKLTLSATKGHVTLRELDAVAHSAVQELSGAKFGLAAMSESDYLVRLAILSSTDALEVLDNALASADLESARELIKQAQGHLLMIRTRSARHIFTDERLDSFEPKGGFSSELIHASAHPSYARSTRSRKTKRRTSSH
jgi:hypothetical protein